MAAKRPPARKAAALPAHGRRRALLLGSLVAAALIIVGRAFQLQAIEGERWRAAAEEQQQARVPLPARRGGIYDRNGNPLALTHETFQVAVAPRELRNSAAVARTLSEVLGISRTAAERVTNRSRRWVLSGRASAAQHRRLAGIRGLHFERRLERYYPQGDIAREIVGVVSGDDRPLGGIEQQLDEVLRGEPGYSVVRRDARGRQAPALNLPVVQPAAGSDVYLSIDLDMQEIADAALRRAISGTGAAGGDLIISDPNSGDLLAAVSRRKGGSRTLSVITEPYEPGSTLKPFYVATLLDAGRAGLDEEVFAENGRWQDPAGRTIRDVHPYGWLTLRDALRVSSNVGMAKFASRLRPSEQFSFLRAAGFGTPTGIEYPAESAGRLRPPDEWSKMSPVSLAIGYEISVTPLQLAAAYGALANGGVLMEPRLVRQIRHPVTGVTYRSEPQPVRRVFTKDVARQITSVLVSVVDEGTARQASLSNFQVAGKTGTARRTGSGGRYEARSYTASFAGYFPAVDPQVVILVKLDEPKGAFYGGLTAAPVTRETLQALLAAHAAPLAGASLLATRAGRRTGGVASPVAPVETIEKTASTTVVLDSMPPAGAGAGVEPETAAVPPVAGLPLRIAVRRIHSAGFNVRLRGRGDVVRTKPAAGTVLVSGDTVTLVAGGK